MQLKEFKPYSFIKACKKFHYPFHRVEVEPIDPLKGDIQIEADAASYNLTFWIIHGFFWFMWYCCVVSFYICYLALYLFYWAICNIIMFVKSKKNDNTDSDFNNQA